VKLPTVLLLLVSSFCCLPSEGQTSIILKETTADSDYQYQIKTKGGTSPFAFSEVPEHPLPVGLNLDAATGLISGRVKQAQKAPYLFGVTVTDSSDPRQAFSQIFSLNVKAAPLQIVDESIVSVAPSETTSANKPEPPIVQGTILASDQTVEGSMLPSATKLEVFYGGRAFSLSQQDLQDQNKSHSGHFVLKVDETAPLIAGETVAARQVVNAATSDMSPSVTIQAVHRNGELATAIVGFEQAGASAAQSAQNFFFNFYISRPLPFDFRRQHLSDEAVDQKLETKDETWDPKLRWWGNVRVASYPQQIDTPVATFASTFAAKIGELKVNELAQSAEFVTGLEYSVFGFSAKSFFGRSEDIRQKFTLAFFAGGGATGPLDPKSSLKIFQVPSQNSPQFQRFIQTYPQAVNSEYIGFVTPDRERFFRTYFGGFRPTTDYLSASNRVPLNSPPAMVSFSVGQNEVVTGGKLSGVVGRIEAFYPLPIGTRSRLSGIYLFGTAMMRLTGAKNIQPFILAPAPTTIQGSDASVAIVSEAGTRDIYRIGVAIDLVSAIRSWTTKSVSDTKMSTNGAGDAPVPSGPAPPVSGSIVPKQ
jgi:hypothetical protein